MKIKTTKMQVRIGCIAVASLLAVAASAGAQSMPIPIKQGLWQTSVSGTMQMQLPPEVQARIAAMPPAQQAQMQAMMGGAAGGTPVNSTNKSCIASQESMDTLLNQAQQKSGMKCTFTNRVQTADGASFDTSCTMPPQGNMQGGTANGHSSFHMPDSEHVTGTTQMTVAMAAKGSTTTMSMNSTMTSTYVGADCGDVKPYTAAAK